MLHEFNIYLTMQPITVFVFGCFCILQTSFVESGIIVDRIKTEISDTRQAVKSGLHRIGGVITRRQDVDCDDNKQDPKRNEIVSGDRGTYYVYFSLI